MASGVGRDVRDPRTLARAVDRGFHLAAFILFHLIRLAARCPQQKAAPLAQGGEHRHQHLMHGNAARFTDLASTQRDPPFRDVHLMIFKGEQFDRACPCRTWSSATSRDFRKKTDHGRRPYRDHAAWRPWRPYAAVASTAWQLLEDYKPCQAGDSIPNLPLIVCNSKTCQIRFLACTPRITLSGVAIESIFPRRLGRLV